MSEGTSQFISDCASKGINQPDGIRAAALDRIAQIDKILGEADLLRKEKATMISVIRSFGFDVAKPRKIVSLSEETKLEELDSITLEYAIKISNFLESYARATPRELMDQFGVLPEKDYEIYATIKWLASSGICSRTSNGTLIPGPNWGERPKKNLKN